MSQSLHHLQTTARFSPWKDQSVRLVRTRLHPLQNHLPLLFRLCFQPSLGPGSSLSGIEALYWAQEYPDEIESIIGLDMAVPEYYENMKINLPLMKLGQYAADLGITRLIPTLAESDAIKHGTLTNDEKNRYRAIFYNRTATVTMINEAKSVKDNAIIVAQNGVPQVPMLLFISDGTGGTGFDKETWRRIQEKYISEVESGKYIELDCPHYVHDYEYGRISEEIKSFLSD